jgi:hypothetical protein
MTSKWVRLVAAQRDYAVEWQPISLRLLNAHVDYDSHFPPEYEAGHTAGLRLLRVVTKARADHGVGAVDRLQAALGSAGVRGAARDRRRGEPARRRVAAGDRARRGRPPVVAGRRARGHRSGTPASRRPPTRARPDRQGRRHADPALPAAARRRVLRPVISRLPSEDDAVALWDHVVGLASFAGFAELKRSLRELPSCPALGVPADQAGVTEDWHAGSRRQKR